MNKQIYANTERLGVNEVERIFLSEFEWIPRTLFQTDVGIDMTVEIAEDGMPTGQLIAIQIKSGESFFKENTFEGIIYRGSMEHLNYWLNYSLPVIIVLHNPKLKVTIWEEIRQDKIMKTDKGWKVEIPKNKTLDIHCKKDLLQTNKLPVYLQRFQRLAVDKNLMRFIQDDGDLVIEIEEWVNKSSGRADLKIFKVINNEDVLVSETRYYHFKSVEDLRILFPWAEFEVDEDYYEEEEEENFIERYGIWDSEEKRIIGTHEDFHEHQREYPKIRALERGSGEIHFFRLLFKLNNLGKSFIEINAFMTFGKQLELNI